MTEGKVMRFCIELRMTVVLFPSFGGVSDEGRRGGLTLAFTEADPQSQITSCYPMYKRAISQ